ncbi:MAG: hypothetical protein KDC98_11525, partial [Planctomycetes bacterium]|nr:hypothetical protein [Planctomycetota bacterium]
MSSNDIPPEQAQWTAETFGLDIEDLLSPAIQTPPIAWPTPAPRRYTAGGFVLGPEQLNAHLTTGDGELTYDPPADTRLPVGAHRITVRSAATEAFESAEHGVEFVVLKAEVTITWPAPAAVVVDPQAGGFRLTAMQLAAVTEPPDVPLRYSQAIDTVLAPGNHALIADVAEPENYEAAPITRQLVVNRCVPVIAWAAPAPREFVAGGYPLSATELCAVQPTGGGALTYDPPADTRLQPGVHRLTVRSAVGALCEPAEAAVEFTVTRVKVTITWPQPPAVVVDPLAGGFKLTATQLCAVTDPPDVPLRYSQAIDTVLAPGSHALTAEVAEPERCEAAPVTVQLTVARCVPVIAWTAPAPREYVAGGYSLSATELCAVQPVGGGALIYDPLPDTRLQPGVHRLTVKSAAGELCEPAEASVEFTVTKAVVKITWPQPAAVDVVAGGFVLGPAQLAATTEPPNVKLRYSPASGTRLGAGEGELVAEIAEPELYEAEAARVRLPVRKLVPKIVWNTPDPCDHLDGGFKLGATQLDATITPGAGALVYTPAANTVLAPGEHELRVEAAATDLCERAVQSVKFVVRKARPRITWNTPADVVYVPGGFVLGATQLNASADLAGVTFKYTPSANTKLDAGEHVLKVESATPDTFEFAPVTVKLKVKKATPVITWQPPAAGIAGAAGYAIGPALNAVRTVGEANLVYSPAGGNLPAGEHQLTVEHPESTNYGYLAVSVRLNVYASALAQQAFEAQRLGGFKPTKPLDPTIKANWDNDAGGLKTQSQQLMRDMQDMTGPEIQQYMDGLTPKADRDQQNGTYPFYMWKLPNGLQVRYKPIGDKHTNPDGKSPVPMFCVEVRKPTCVGFSKKPQDIATKVSIGGELGPVGPGETPVPQGLGANQVSYVNGSQAATHLTCRQNKVAQVIHAAGGDIQHGVALTPELLNVRLQPGAGKITLTPAAGTKPPIGDNQTVRIDADATSRFGAATANVVIHVKKAKPQLSWRPPADVDWVPGGFKLSATQLAATVDPADLAAAIVYAPATGAALAPGRHTLTAKIAAAAICDEAKAEVE